MITLTLKCHLCGKEFTRLLKEHNRRSKNGKLPFCSNVCSGKYSKTVPAKITCTICSSEHVGHSPTKKYCSVACRSIALFSRLQRKRAEKATRPRKPGSGGFRLKGGKCKEYFTYTNWLGESMLLNGYEVRLAKQFDLARVLWNRNFKGFTYTDEKEKLRRYYPDFYVKDFDVYVEFKGWTTPQITHKMLAASTLANIRLVVVFSNDKRYSNLGPSIGYIEQNKLSILSILKLCRFTGLHAETAP